MDFDLRLLLHARTLAEEGSFARAARILHLTQPALSRSIQELERRTGMSLFDRRKGRVEPTDSGRLFLAHARDVLNQAESMQREVVQLRGSGSGRLVIGVGPYPAAMFMGAAVGAFLRKNPRASIRLVGGDWPALAAALRRRELDLIVAGRADQTDAGDLAIHPLTSRKAHFFVRPGHPLLGRNELSLEHILAHPFVAAARLPSGLAHHMLESLKDTRDAQGRTLPDVLCESIDVAREIVQATDHVLLATIAANRKPLEAGELAVLPYADPLIGADFAVIHLEGRSLPPIAAEFIDDVTAADRASAGAERALAERLLTTVSRRSSTRTRTDRETARAASA